MDSPNEELINKVVEYMLSHTELCSTKESEFYTEDMIMYEEPYFMKIVPKTSDWQWSKKRIDIWKKFANASFQ